MKLSDLTNKTKAITIDVDGEALNLTVRTAVVTPKFIADFAGLQTADTTAQIEALPELTMRLIASWDLLGDDGAPIPLVNVQLAEIPVEILNVVILAAMNALGEVKAPEQETAVA